MASRLLDYSKWDTLTTSSDEEEEKTAEIPRKVANKVAHKKPRPSDLTMQTKVYLNREVFWHFWKKMSLSDRESHFDILVGMVHLQQESMRRTAFMMPNMSDRSKPGTLMPVVEDVDRAVMYKIEKFLRKTLVKKPFKYLFWSVFGMNNHYPNLRDQSMEEMKEGIQNLIRNAKVNKNLSYNSTGAKAARMNVQIALYCAKKLGLGCRWLQNEYNLSMIFVENDTRSPLMKHVHRCPTCISLWLHKDKTFFDAYKQFCMVSTIWAPIYWGEWCVIKCKACGVLDKNTTNQMSACARCGDVFYCSRRCQKHDWGDHKKDCKKSSFKLKDARLRHSICYGPPDWKPKADFRKKFKNEKLFTLTPDLERSWQIFKDKWALKCGYCGERNIQKLKPCKRCSVTHYCSKRCRIFHKKKHKKVCVIYVDPFCRKSDTLREQSPTL